MILKFRTDSKEWVYHEIDEVFVKEEYQDIEEYKDTGAVFYTQEAEAKIAHFRLKDSTLKSAVYSMGYLLNDKGDTINCI